MIDLHSHILPGIDDGARDLDVSLEMARRYVDQGVTTVACTPHILPGVYHNTGPAIREAVSVLQDEISAAGIGLTLTTGADNHVVADFVGHLRTGHLLPLGSSRFVLVEPPHHVAPARLDDLFFSILVAGYVPILTHPERLTWIESKYPLMVELAGRGVWMQITSGSLRGKFGRRPQYWAERMLAEGLVHILATDAHSAVERRPDLREGFDIAVTKVGFAEATHLVVTRPLAILEDRAATEIPVPSTGSTDNDVAIEVARTPGDGDRPRRSLVGRLRNLFAD